MENAAKALGIAAGVLLAVILMSLIAYFFSNISEWPQQQDDMESAEQLAKFNKEYEVYEKSQMYGVDVISCLNKAKSNNEKYVDGTGFLTGTTYEKKYIVDVCVRINSELDEDMAVYYFSPDKGAEDLIKSSTDLTLENALPSIADKFDSSLYYTEFKRSDKLEKKNNKLTSSKYMIPGGGSEIYNEKNYYSLVNDEQVEKLVNLISTTPKVTIKNSGTNSDLSIWSKVIWTTALYKFKTKRFTCDYINYNSTTGRVDKVYFSEIE